MSGETQSLQKSRPEMIYVNYSEIVYMAITEIGFLEVPLDEHE